MVEERSNYNDNGSWSAHNHPSVEEHKDVLDRALASEVHQRSALLLDEAARFLIPTFLPVPLGIVPKSGGKHRVIADSSFIPVQRSNVPPEERALPRSVNAATTKESVTTCRYGTALLCMVYFLVNLRIQYPSLPIYFMLVDTNNAFRHCRVNYAVMPLVTAWCFFSLVVFTGMSFGAVWSPGNYSIVEELVSNTLGTLTLDTIRRNRDALAFAEAFRQPDPDTAADSKVPTRKIREDMFNPGLTFCESSRLYARCFVDDFFLLCIKVCDDAFHLSLAALLWSKLVWFSHVAAPLRQSFVALKKLGPFSTSGKALGYLFDTAQMTMRVPDAKLASLRDTLRQWVDGSQELSVLEIQSLLGNIRFATVALPMGSFLSARLNAHLVDIECTLRGHRSKRHKGGPQTFPVPALARAELDQLLFYLEHERVVSYFSCHIERLLLRFPDFDCPSDASGFGCGGWCKQLRIGWAFTWPESVKEYFSETRSINMLEYFGVIMNMFFMNSLLESSSVSDPACYFWTDNQAARAWSAAAHIPSTGASALSLVLDALASHSTMHTRSGHVAGVINVIADTVSRSPASWSPQDSHTSGSLTQLHRSSPPAQLTAVLSPPPELVSLLLAAMLHGTSPPVPRVIEIMTAAKFNTL
jgi:hypothetical protein